MTGNRGSFLECEFVDVVGGENGNHSSSSYFPIVIDNMNTWSSMVLSNIWISTKETAGGSDAKPYGSLGIMWNKSAGTNGMSFIANNWALSGLENADESTKWVSAQNAMKILVSGSSSNVPGTGGGGGFATIFYDQSLTVDSDTTSTGGYNSTGWDRFPTMWGVNINLEDLNPTTSPLFGTQGDIQISGNTAWIKVGDIGKDTDWVEITNSGGTDTFVTGGTFPGAFPNTLVLNYNTGGNATAIDLTDLVFSWSDPVVTAGNTSGDCIDQLWVHTISGCSPVTIGSSIQDITSTATGTHSIAYGSGTTSSGNYSHAEGYGTEAEGNSSHSQGTRTFAGGESSHAGGHQSNSGKTLFINNTGGFGHYTVTEPLDKGIDSTCDYSAILGGIDHFISDGQTTSIILGGNSNSISGSSGSSNQTIIGGNSNRIYPINAFFGSSNNIIAGGDGNFINSSSATGGNSIMGGGNHVITDNVSNSSIIGGEDNVFNSALVRSVILGGVGITGSSNDTVYVPNLNIGSVGSGTPLISLGLDSNGNVVTGTTGGGSSSTITGYTYNETNNTFSIGISGSTPFDATISEMSGLTLNGDLTVTGNTQLDGDLIVEGLTTLKGQTTIGNSFGDSVDIVARVTANIVPSVTNSVDLGTSSLFWKDLYTHRITGGTLNLYSSLTTNNSGTEILVRNSTTGNIEKRDVSTLTGGTGGGQTITGYTYNESNNTFSIGISGSTPLDSTINVVSGLTVTNNLIVSGNTGMGTDTPQEKLDVRGDVLIENGGIVYSDLSNAIMPKFVLSATSSTLGNIGVTNPQGAGLSIGYRGETEPTYDGYGKQGDGYLYSSAAANGLNIISQQGTNKDDYVRFYVGQSTGASSGNTPDIHIQGSGATRGNVGINTKTPTEKLDVRGDFVTINTGGGFKTDLNSAAGPAVQVSGGSIGLPRVTVVDTPNTSSLTMGVRGWSDVSYPGYGKPGDGFIYSSDDQNGLNILSTAGSGTEDYIKFFAGNDADGTTSNMFIDGTGSTKGFVGINTESPTERLHIAGSIRIVDGTEQNGYVLTSDATGVSSWQPASGGTGTSYWVLTGTSNEVLVDAQGLNGYSISGSSPGSIIAGGTGHTLSDSQNSAIVGGLANTVLNSSSYLGGDSHFGGTLNIISGNTLLHYGNINVGGGSNVTIGSVRSVMLSTTDSKMIDSTNGFIIGGGNHKGGVNGYGLYHNSSSGIVGGTNNTFASGVTRSVIIGGNGLSATTNDTVYVPNLNINSVGSGTPLISLGLDSNGNVVTSTTGGTPFSWSDPVVTSGNTSGDCITNLWVSNIHSCSPLYINPADDGNVYYGSSSGITIDIINKSIGINTNTPLGGLDIRQDNLYVSNEVGK